jgi:hypothetical protein
VITLGRVVSSRQERGSSVGQATMTFHESDRGKLHVWIDQKRVALASESMHAALDGRITCTCL